MCNAYHLTKLRFLHGYGHSQRHCPWMGVSSLQKTASLVNLINVPLTRFQNCTHTRADTGLTWPPPDPHRVARQSTTPRHINMEPNSTSQRLRHRGVARPTEQTSFTMTTSHADESSDSEDNPDEKHEWRNAEGETLKDFGVDPEDDNDMQSLPKPLTSQSKVE